MKEEIENFSIPIHIIELYQKKYDTYPSILKTRNITNEGLKILIEKNSIEWLESEITGKTQIYLQGTIKYGKKEIFIYFKKLEHENIYNMKILYSLKEVDNVNFLLVGLNKYFTID